jgi:hypothetical protein
MLVNYFKLDTHEQLNRDKLMKTESIPNTLDLYTNFPVEKQPSKWAEVPSKQTVARDTEDVWASIVPFLSNNDVAHCSALSRSHNNIIDTPYVWKNVASQNKQYRSDRRMMIEDGKLYIMTESSIFIWDILKAKKANYIQLSDKDTWLTDITFGNNILCAVHGKGLRQDFRLTIQMIDAIRGKILKKHRLDAEFYSIRDISIMGGLLIAYGAHNSNIEERVSYYKIMFIDLNTGKILDTIKHVHDDNKEVNPDILGKIIEKTKLHRRDLQPFPPEPSSTKHCLIQ